MLKGKNTVITGARRGIGRATVEVFAENGANIWACARKKDAMFEQDMARIAEAHGVQIEPVYFDLTDEAQIKQAIKQIQSTKRPVDILVNNAGVMPENSLFVMIPAAKLRETFELNFFSQMILTQYISRLMIRKHSGSIINLSSMAAIDGAKAQLGYVGSKAAIAGATKQLSIELGEHGIRVNAVAPGVIESDMSGQIEGTVMQNILSKTVMKRIGNPREVANVIAFLASDQASYVTGQIIRVDGGL